MVGASPTFAKWPFIVITEGAVGNREAVEGLLWPFVVDDDMAGEKSQYKFNRLELYLVTLGGVPPPCPPEVNWAYDPISSRSRRAGGDF